MNNQQCNINVNYTQSYEMFLWPSNFSETRSEFSTFDRICFIFYFFIDMTGIVSFLYRHIDPQLQNISKSESKKADVFVPNLEPNTSNLFD